MVTTTATVLLRIWFKQQIDTNTERRVLNCSCKFKIALLQFKARAWIPWLSRYNIQLSGKEKQSQSLRISKQANRCINRSELIVYAREEICARLERLLLRNNFDFQPTFDASNTVTYERQRIWLSRMSHSTLDKFLKAKAIFEASVQFLCFFSLFSTCLSLICLLNRRWAWKSTNDNNNCQN